MPFLFIFEAHTSRVIWFLAIWFLVMNIIARIDDCDSINDTIWWL